MVSMGDFSCLLLVLLVGISTAAGAANESQEPCAYDASGMPDGKGSCSRKSNTDTSLSFETEALLQTTLLRQHKEMKLEDVYDYPSCRPACLVNNGGCPGGEGCHQVSGRIYRVQGACYKAVGGCWGCLESPQNYVEALNPVQCPEAPMSTPTPDVYDYPSCRPACLVNNGGCPGGEGCHQVSGRIYRVQGTCYKAVGGCWGCLESPQNYVEALNPVQCPEAPMLTPTTDVYDYPSCRPACLVNNGGCPGGEGCHQVSGRIYRVQGTCYTAVGGCWGCLESPKNYAEALSPVQCPEEPITSTIQCCTAARPTVNNQVGICGCDATAFPSGGQFYLADKLLTVKNAWTTACTGQGTGCQGKCASVNFQNTHWWPAGAAIKFKGNTCPSGSVGPPATATTPAPPVPTPAPASAAPSGCNPGVGVYWEGKLKSAGIGQSDIDKICYNDVDSQWYYNGKGTKVGYGQSSEPCDDKKLKCRLKSGESFNGYSKQQAAWVKAAIQNGGVFP